MGHTTLIALSRAKGLYRISDGHLAVLHKRDYLDRCVRGIFTSELSERENEWQTCTRDQCRLFLRL